MAGVFTPILGCVIISAKYGNKNMSISYASITSRLHYLSSKEGYNEQTTTSGTG
jgi:hypothetical protein